MQELLQPSQSTLLVRSPTEGSMKSYSRYGYKDKKRIIYKNKKGEIVDGPAVSQHSNSQNTIKSRTITPSPSESVKTQTNSVTDFLPLDDPLWLELIPQEIQQDPNFNLEKLILENQEYFINLLGLYMMERQQNKMQELKVSLPQKKMSTYDQVYKKFNSFDQSGSLFNIKMYDQPPLMPSLHIQSQYETSFKTPKPQHSENFKPLSFRDQNEMSSLTSYRQDYVNWKPCLTERVGPQRGQSTGALPFIGKTNYQECFKQAYGEPSESAKKKTMGPFAVGSQMIFKEALYKQHYPNYKEDQLLNPSRKQNSSHQQMNGSYDGQFKTTFKNSFAFKVPEPILQDRYWKSKLLQKIMEKKLQ